jgi:V/A-type H+-transporting ATPase subunit F
MYKIAVLGDRDSVLGFRALGLEVFFVQEAQETKSLINRLSREQYAVIYITEQLAEELKTVIDEYKDDVTPAIILIPGKEGSLGIGMKNVHESVERAVGVDILAN